MSELPEKSSKPAARKPGKSASKSARSRAREFALQALYQVLVGKNEASDIDCLRAICLAFTKPIQRITMHSCMAAQNKLPI